MNEQTEIAKSPRADTLEVESAHDQWALHSFAFEQNADWLPTNLRCYHKDRFINGELMEGYYDEFVPEAYDTERGKILKKEVVEKTAYCPDCEVAAKKFDGDVMCPECGLLCSGKGPSAEIIRDPKAAGRVDQT